MWFWCSSVWSGIRYLENSKNGDGKNKNPHSAYSIPQIPFKGPKKKETLESKTIYNKNESSKIEIHNIKIKKIKKIKKLPLN